MYLAGLRGIAAHLPDATYGPLNAEGAFGWMMEEGHTGHPAEPAGGLGYALNYLRHMIDQGLEVAYAVSVTDGGRVYLQNWEPGNHSDPNLSKRPWPDDPGIVFQAEAAAVAPPGDLGHITD